MHSNGVILTQWMKIGELCGDIARYEKEKTPYHYANSIASIIKMNGKYYGYIEGYTNLNIFLSNENKTNKISDDSLELIKLKVDIKLFELGYCLDNLFQ